MFSKIDDHHLMKGKYNPIKGYYPNFNGSIMVDGRGKGQVSELGINDQIINTIR